MTEERHSEVLGGLPRTRPHRRSDKRASNRVSPPATDTPVDPQATEVAPAVPAPQQTATANETSTTKATPSGKATSTTKAKPKPRPKTRSKPAAAAAKPNVSPGAKKAATKPAPASASPRGSARLRQPAQPAGSPTRGRAPAVPGPETRTTSRPAVPKRGELVGTAVQAAAELAEIGLSVGARAIRRAVSRLPRP